MDPRAASCEAAFGVAGWRDPMANPTTLRWPGCGETTGSPTTRPSRTSSPYEADRSALTDCVKLATSSFACRTGVVVYGFDYPDRSLKALIDAFEALALRRVQLGSRQVARMSPLVHPVHSMGRVFGWEVAPKAS